MFVVLFHSLVLTKNLMFLQKKIISVLFQLSEDPGYVLYSALGSFYIPSCIMVFVYINIYFAARSVCPSSSVSADCDTWCFRARARRHIKPKNSILKKEVRESGVFLVMLIAWYFRTTPWDKLR